MFKTIFSGESKSVNKDCELNKKDEVEVFPQYPNFTPVLAISLQTSSLPYLPQIGCEFNHCMGFTSIAISCHFNGMFLLEKA